MPRGGEWVTIELPANAMYVVLQGQVTSSEVIKKKEVTVKVYPNPASSVLNIETGSEFNIRSASIITVEGIRVVSIRNQHKSNHFQMDISGLITGIYFLEIEPDGFPVEMHKFLIR